MLEIKTEKRSNNICVFVNIPIKDERNKVTSRLVGKPVQFVVSNSDRIPNEVSTENAILTLSPEDARQLGRQLIAEAGKEN